jgi:S-adenosylmethionine hydrolase
VISIDHFGNLQTNLPADLVQNLPGLLIRVAGKEIRALSRTFSDRPPGELIALIDEDGKLAISVVNGSAEQELGLSFGAPIEVISGA